MWDVRILLIALICFLPSFAIANSENIVATVGDVPITIFEVERQATRIMPFNVSFHGTVTEDKKDEIREKALDDLILRAYKICYANSIKLKIPEALIAEKIEKIKEKLKTPEEFQRAVMKETEVGLRASIQRGFLASAGEKSAVDSNMSVSDESIKSFYDENKQMFLKPRQFRASHILVKVDPAATEDVRLELEAKAAGLVRQAKAGEDFYNLAYHNSDDRTSFVGGDMGMFHESQVAKPIQEALVGMKVDDISDVVETIAGYHVLKLTQVNEPRQLSFDDVKGQIRAMLEGKQRDTLYVEWMQILKKTYKVVRFDS